MSTLAAKENISLDNSSHPMRGPDELVPSRYALKVGKIDVIVISDGVLSLPSAMLGHNADPAVRPDFSRVSMPPGFPDALRRTAKRFLNEYHNQLRPLRLTANRSKQCQTISPDSVWAPR